MKRPMEQVILFELLEFRLGEITFWFIPKNDGWNGYRMEASDGDDIYPFTRCEQMTPRSWHFRRNGRDGQNVTLLLLLLLLLLQIPRRLIEWDVQFSRRVAWSMRGGDRHPLAMLLPQHPQHVLPQQRPRSRTPQLQLPPLVHGQIWHSPVCFGEHLQNL